MPSQCSKTDHVDIGTGDCQELRRELGDVTDNCSGLDSGSQVTIRSARAFANGLEQGQLACQHLPGELFRASV